MFNLVKEIKKIVNKLNSFEASTISASNSFYLVVATYSLLSLALQLYNFIFIEDNNMILSIVYKYVDETYHTEVENIFNNLSINRLSPLLIISLMWSSSKVINGYNKSCDIIYKEVKKRNYLLNRISSFLMFICMIGIFSFELFSLVFASNLITKIFKNTIIYYALELILELLLIFTIVLLLYIYAPPVKMKVKDAIYGSLFSTFLLYISSVLFIFIIKLYQSISQTFSFFTIISSFLVWTYIINYIIILGFIVNYYIYKK